MAGRLAQGRISCFDHPLKEQIPHKGHVLTEITSFWFDKTRDIIDNHIICRPDPNVLVAESEDPRVRAFLTRGEEADPSDGTADAKATTK